MFLSDRDLQWALKHGKLLVDPPPTDDRIGPTSIDLRLDRIEEAKIWDIPKFKKKNRELGHGDVPELLIGSFDYKEFAREFLIRPPDVSRNQPVTDLVFRRADAIVVRPRGFVLWQTKEKVGTPEEGAQLICFVDGKSTRARTGLLVHMTAPTIHAAWGAWPVTLEIGNLGPFDLVLHEDDIIAQITVANISSIPEKNMRASGSVTAGQTDVTAQAAPGPQPG
jgi:dCTP deaminase